jgi:hypothetical protein
MNPDEFEINYYCFDSSEVNNIVYQKLLGMPGVNNIHTSLPLPFSRIPISSKMGQTRGKSVISYSIFWLLRLLWHKKLVLVILFAPFVVRA